MPTTQEKPVSLVQVARTIFRTRSPSEEQIYRVYELMTSGVLPSRDGGSSPLKWTTTEAALAEFLANHQMRRATVQRGDGSDGEGHHARPTTAQDDRAARLQGVYRNIWRDYFLAVLMRRRMAHRTVAFHRAVIAGQTLLLLLLVGAVAGSGWQIAARSISAERRAVKRWIAQNTDDFRIDQWRASEPYEEGDGLLVGVEYRYRKTSRRWIHTDRTFIVAGDAVTELVFDD